MAREVVFQDAQPVGFTVDREHLKAIMREAGLLAEPGPVILASAAQSTLTLDEAAEILSRGDGPSFSQQVDEERGPQD